MAPQVPHVSLWCEQSGSELCILPAVGQSIDRLLAEASIILYISHGVVLR